MTGRLPRMTARLLGMTRPFGMTRLFGMTARASLTATLLACLGALAPAAPIGPAAAPVVAAPALAAAGDRPSPTIELSLSRDRVTTPLGGGFDFVSRVTNRSSRPATGLVAHLNVVGLSEDIYVDPEDWSEDRTKRLGPLGPGESTEVPWSVKAVTGGEAAIYVAVLPGESPSSAPSGPAVSPALDVRITERRTLNSGGVLPLALGVPALLGIATLVVRRRRQRSSA